MNIFIREYKTQDAEDAAEIWNQVVRDGVAFPQEKELTTKEADNFFKEQIYTGIAENKDTGMVVGLYILHPNNVGRCGHICNASYAVKKDIRGQHIGEKLVKDCIVIRKKSRKMPKSQTTRTTFTPLWIGKPILPSTASMRQ